MLQHIIIGQVLYYIVLFVLEVDNPVFGIKAWPTHEKWMRLIDSLPDFLMCVRILDLEELLILGNVSKWKSDLI